MGTQQPGILDDAQRLAAVEQARAIGDSTAQRLDALVRLARTLLDVPVAAVNLVGREDVRPLAVDGEDPWRVARDEGPCSLVVRDGREIVVDDAKQDPRLRDLAPVAGDPHLRFYAARPIRPSGHTIGTLCLWGREPRTLSTGDRRMFEDLTSWIETQLEVESGVEEAREVQAKLLPSRPPAIEGLSVAGRCLPTRAIGGDLYDWRLVQREQEELLQVGVVDVMGKGLSAAVTAAGLRAVLRGTARFSTLDDMLVRLSESLLTEAEDLDDGLDPILATLFSARLHPDGRVWWVDAGHGLACILSRSGSVRILSSGEPALGVDQDVAWTVHEDRLGADDVLLIVSDGVVGPFSDLQAQSPQLASLWRDVDGPAALVDRVVDLGLLSSGGSHVDDITVLAVARRAP
ncbi:SpoIIE family protein phosphatase [Nocardioidaceae bacterium]|nr:SpoIIE family protein phosphatase [Nocardioidaceae bacterium]